MAVSASPSSKTANSKPARTCPADLEQQHLLGDRQHDFLRAWNTDWAGQDLKLVASQSPWEISTPTPIPAIASASTTGTPTAGRSTAATRRGDCCAPAACSNSPATSTSAASPTTGVTSPRDAGILLHRPRHGEFLSPHLDPVHNATGTTSTVSPYKGDYYFNGVGTLPDGVTPNLTANRPAHIAMLAAANSEEYYNRTSGSIPPTCTTARPATASPASTKTREITFEAWPLYADPEFPQTGSQYRRLAASPSPRPTTTAACPPATCRHRHPG